MIFMLLNCLPVPPPLPGRLLLDDDAVLALGLVEVELCPVAGGEVAHVAFELEGVGAHLENGRVIRFDNSSRDSSC